MTATNTFLLVLMCQTRNLRLTLSLSLNHPRPVQMNFLLRHGCRFSFCLCSSEFRLRCV